MEGYRDHRDQRLFCTHNLILFNHKKHSELIEIASVGNPLNELYLFFVSNGEKWYMDGDNLVMSSISSGKFIQKQKQQVHSIWNSVTG